MENFIKQGSVSPQTQTSGGQRREGREKERRKVQSQKWPWQDVWVTGMQKHTQPTMNQSVNNQHRIKGVGSLDVYFHRLPDLFSGFGFNPGDHRSQAYYNWTRRAASRLSLCLITNYNRGQLKLPKLYSKQCWVYYPWQRNLHSSKHKMESRLGFLFPTHADWKQQWVLL